MIWLTSLLLSMPLSAAIQLGATHLEIKTENSKEPDTLTSAKQLPPENGLAVLMTVSRYYKSWPTERLGATDVNTYPDVLDNRPTLQQNLTCLCL